MSIKLLALTTRKNWWINTFLATNGLLAIISGIYFLAIPSGGYQGGRNPYYGLVLLFDRHTWGDLHTWGSLGMIGLAVVHISLHWKWFKSMVRRTFYELTGRCSCMNPRGRWNLVLNLVVAISFLVTAMSGTSLFFLPHGRGNVEAVFIFTRSAWDEVHTWAGVVFSLAVIFHFAIHWRWVVKVGRRMLAGGIQVSTPAVSKSSL